VTASPEIVPLGVAAAAAAGAAVLVIRLSLRKRLTSAALAGPAIVKYIPRNPANSIVICEEWSGLRARKGGSPE
jgi:hypothetical protein